MGKFAFIIHPIDPKRDVARRFRMLSHMPVSWIHFFSRYFPPLYLSHVTGIRSAAGREAEGWLLACPYTATRMLTLNVEEVYRKIVQVAQLGQRLGARIIGLGAFTSVVGDAGISISQRLEIPITTGNSYAVATVMHTMTEAGRRLGVEMREALVAVVGATGSIGSACIQYAARQGARTLAVGRNGKRLAQLASLFADQGLSTPEVTTNLEDIRKADMVIAAASSDQPIIEPEHLKSGAIVCDVALPRNVSPQVFRLRSDVLVVDGGMVRVPGNVKLGFDFGLPPGMVYACMAEAMILALEERYESFTLGRDISPSQVETIDLLATKHGFHVEGLRSLGHAVTDEDLDKVKKQSALAHRRRVFDLRAPYAPH